MYEASPNQIRHWRHYRRFPESPALNMTVALLLEGAVERAALQRAATAALSRHEALTARPVEVQGCLYWRPVQPEPGTSGTVMHVECADREEALAALRDEAGRPFQLESELPARLKLVTVNRQRAILIVNIHHIACDGWSVDLLVKEIATLYAGYRTDVDAALPPALGYEDFSRYQRDYPHSAAGAADARYWADVLRDAPTGIGFAPDAKPDTPSSWPRGKMTWAFMPASLSDGLRAAAKSAGVTPFVFLMAGFARLLARSSGATDLVVGVPYLNRLRLADASLVGFAVNTLPLRFRDTDLGNTEFIRAVAATTRSAFTHQRLPYYQMLSELGPEFESGAKPVFRTMFILQSSQSARNQFQDIDSRQCWVSTGGAKYDQTWTIEERDGTYTLDVEWNPDLYTQAYVHALMEQYRALVHALAADFAHVAAYGGGLQWPALDTLRNVFSGPVVLEHGAQIFPADAECGIRAENLP